MTTIAAIIAVLVLLFVIVSITLSIITRHNRELTVPDFSGMPLAQATLLAQQHHLRLDVTDSVYIRNMERGNITRQNPDPGSKVKKNRRILLTINSVLPKRVEMPSLIGFSLRQAKTELISKGLDVGRLIYIEDMATNNVLAQKLNGEDIEPGVLIESETPIDLILGLNSYDNMTYVPNVIGYKYQMALDIIHDNSLNIYKTHFDETVFTYSDSLEAAVYNQYPASSDSIQVRMGTSMTLYLSKDQSKIGNPYGF